MLPILFIGILISAYFWLTDGISAYSYFWTFFTAAFICRRWQGKHSKGSVSEVAARNAKEVFYIFASAACIYSVLQFLLSRGAYNTTAVTTINEVHDKLMTLRLWMKPVAQLRMWQELLIVSGLILVARRLPSIQESKLLQAHKTANKAIKYAYLAVTAALSFSVAGSSIAPAISDVRVRLLSEIGYIQSSFASLEKELEHYAGQYALFKSASAPDIRSVIGDLALFKANVAVAEAVRTSGPHAEWLRNERPAFQNDIDNFGRGAEDLTSELKRVQLGNITNDSEKIDLSGESRASADALTVQVHEQLSKVLQREVADDVAASGMQAIVERAAELSGKNMVQQILDALLHRYPGDPQLEVFKALYEPFLKTPVQELAKKAARRGYKNLVMRMKTSKDVAQDIRSAVDSVDLSRSETLSSKTASAISARRIESAAFEPEIRTSIVLAGKRLFDEASATLSRKWEQTIKLERNIALRTAAADDLPAIVESKISSIPGDDLGARARAIREFTATLNSLPTQARFRWWILDLEGQTAPNGIYLKSAHNMAEPNMKSEKESSWGKLRALMDQDVPVWHLDPNAKATALRILNRWHDYRLFIALSAADKGKLISAEGWDKEFYEVTEHDDELAVLWGFHLEHRRTDEVARFMNEEHPIDFSDKTVKPVSAYAYFAEGSFGNNWSDISSRFRQPRAHSAITVICNGGDH